MWRWLWNAKSGVTESDDKVSCMLLTKRLVYACSEQVLENIKSEINRSEFQQYRERIAECWRRKEEWALCYVETFLQEEIIPTIMQRQQLESPKTFFLRDGKLGMLFKCFVWLQQPVGAGRGIVK